MDELPPLLELLRDHGDIWRITGSPAEGRTAWCARRACS